MAWTGTLPFLLVHCKKKHTKGDLNLGTNHERFQNHYSRLQLRIAAL